MKKDQSASFAHWSFLFIFLNKNQDVLVFAPYPNEAFLFDQLSFQLTRIFDKLRGRGALTEEDVTSALREVRIALLEADVALPVVKTFIEDIKREAIGKEVMESIHPAQLVIKIVHDHLTTLLGEASAELSLSAQPPVVMVMVGLQGSGKTTTTAKLAKRLREKNNKKVLMASLDIYRPAAQEQLAVLAHSLSIDVLPVQHPQKPLDILSRAQKQAQLGGYDVLLLDTAGRLQIDETLMDELSLIIKQSRPKEVLLVADSMMGQEAATIAKTFHDRVGLTGLILTRIDGDARGGAALSMRTYTQAPIKFLGTGEKVGDLEPFHPERLAKRILGMGDIVALVEKAMETVDHNEAEALLTKTQKGTFTLEDLATQLRQLTKMGGLSGILSLLPGAHKIQDKLKGHSSPEPMIKKQLAIISSMTPQERRSPDILNASRKKRIASGSASQIQDINKLLKQHRDMATMMKRMNKLGKKGFLRQGLKGMMP